MPAAIDVQGLNVHYGNIPALTDVSLTITPGEYVLLAGPSGCGKSTLALALSGIIPHVIPAQAEGQVRVVSLDVRTCAPAELARTVGIVFQDPTTQLFNESVWDEVGFGPRNLGLAEPEIALRAVEALRAAGIAQLRDRSLRQLSGGEQQRVAIAAALAMGPQLLVLDEPLANLDAAGVGLVLDTLDRLHQRGVTILLIEHRLEAVLSRVQRVILLDSGRIAADSPPESVSLGALGYGPSLSPRPPRPPPTRDRVPLVSLRGVRAGYGRQQVLNGVDLDLYRQEMAAVVGPNGSGKTTLAKVLAGILRPRRGSVHWHGSRQLASRKPRVALVAQHPEHQLVCDSVAEEVAYGPANYRLDSSARLAELLRVADLEAVQRRAPHCISAGEQQRTAAAANIALEPQLLILDEPTLGQDPRHLAQTMSYVERLNRAGQAVLLITHDDELVQRYAERVLRLEGGRLVEVTALAQQARAPAPILVG